MVKDLVCKMEVNQETTKWSMEYNNAKYYFCCEECLNDFEMDPEFYLGLSEDDDQDSCGSDGCSGCGVGCPKQ
jgi:Cu+-exporting ATPase